MTDALQQLSTLPVPPNRKSDSQDEFDRKVPITLDAQVNMVQELNADTIPKLNAISVVSNTILPHLTNIDTVAGISDAVTTTASIKDNIAEILRNETNINTVSGISEDVTRVAKVDKDVKTLVPSLGDIAAVADIVTDVVAVSSVKEAVTIDALHINTIDAVGARADEVDALAMRIGKIDTLAEKVGAIDTNALHIVNIDAVGNSINAVLNADANMNAIAEAPEYARTAEAKAIEATRQAELAKQYADSASAVAGLPVATEQNDRQMVIWAKEQAKYVLGPLANESMVPAPGIVLPPQLPIGFPVDVVLTGLAGIVGASIVKFTTQVNDGQLNDFPVITSDQGTGSYTDTITPTGNDGDLLTYKALVVDDRGNTSHWNMSTSRLIQAFINKPTITSPNVNSIVSNIDIRLTCSAFATTHIADTHKASRWMLTADEAGNNILHDSGWKQDALTTYTAVIDPAAPANTALYAFVWHKGNILGQSVRSEGLPVKTSYVLTPAVIAPVPSTLVSSQSIVITGNAFTTYGGSFDTHEETRWKVTTDPEGNNALYDSGWTSTDLTQVTASLNPIAPPATALYLWVQYRGASLGDSARSNAIQVQTGSVMAPTVVTPAEGDIVPLSGFTVTGSAFEPVTGSVDTMTALYCQVATDKNFVTIIYDSGLVATASTTHNVVFGGVKPGQNVQVYIRMRYEGAALGVSVYSEVRSVRTTKTGTVSITSPANGAIGVDLQPDITMTSYNDTGGFDSGVKTQVQLSSVVNFASTVYDSGEITYTTSHKVTNVLDVDAPLFCRVRHFGNALGATDWSEVVAFRTMAGYVYAPIIQSPVENGFSLPTSLTIIGSQFTSFGAIDTLKAITIQVSTDIEFTNLLYNLRISTTSTTHSVTFTEQVQGSSLYVRIKYEGNMLGESDFSEIRKIAVTTVLTPNITSPSNNATNVVFKPIINISSWSDTGKLDTGYRTRIQISSVQNFATILWDSGDISYTTRIESGVTFTKGQVIYVKGWHTGKILGKTQDAPVSKFTTSNREDFSLEDVFTSVGNFSFTVPGDTTKIRVLCIGGGAKGEDFNGATAGRGGKGGAMISAVIDVVPGQTFPLTVGGKGGTSSFDGNRIKSTGGTLTNIGTGTYSNIAQLIMDRRGAPLYQAAKSFKDMGLNKWVYDPSYAKGSDGENKTPYLRAATVGTNGSLNANGYGVGGEGGGGSYGAHTGIAGGTGGRGGNGGGIGGEGGIGGDGGDKRDGGYGGDGGDGGYGGKGAVGGDGGYGGPGGKGYGGSGGVGGVGGDGGRGGDGSTYGGSGGMGGRGGHGVNASRAGMGGRGGDGGYGGNGGIGGSTGINAFWGGYGGDGGPGCVVIWY